MFNKLDKEVYDIAEAAKKVMTKEAEVRPGEKSTEKMVKAHPIVKKDDPEQDPKNAKGVEYKVKGMSEGKMKDLHALVAKGVKDPKKIAKELRLPGTPEVHKAIASLVKDMKEGLDPVNQKAVVKKFGDRKDKDIDNDGDVDDSDEYLHKRRKAISKATGKPKKEDDRSFDKKKVAEAVNYDFLDEASEYILEEGNIDHLSDEQLDEVLKTIATKVGQGIGAVAKAGGRAASAGAKKVANRLSTSGRADAAEKRADKLDKKRADRERLAKAKDRIRKAKEDQKADKDRERKAREAERKAAQQDREDSKNESVNEAKMAVGDEVSFEWPASISMGSIPPKNRKPNGFVKGILTKVDSKRAKVKIGNKVFSVSTSDLIKEMKESAQLDERNDALYLIYKDKIKAMKVNNYIKKTYRGKAESEFAPMDAKNFGVSVFADKRADKILKDVTKKFGKPDDHMLEGV